MLKEALEYLDEMHGDNPKVIEVHDLGDSIHKLVVAPGRESDVDVYEKPPRHMAHTLYTLEGLVKSLEGKQKDDEFPAHVFVGKTDIIADLHYGSHVNRMLRVPLDFSTEYAALHRCREIVQKAFWRALVTDLDGHIDESLAMTVASIRMSSKSDAKVVISNLGVTASSGSSSTEVQYDGERGDGPQTQTIKTDWVFTGRIYEAFDEDASIALRLEVQENGGSLVFTLHRAKSETIERAERLNIVDKLVKEVPAHVFVVEGERFSGFGEEFGNGDEC